MAELLEQMVTDSGLYLSIIFLILCNAAHLQIPTFRWIGPAIPERP